MPRGEKRNMETKEESMELEGKWKVKSFLERENINESLRMREISKENENRTNLLSFLEKKEKKRGALFFFEREREANLFSSFFSF